MGDGYRPFCGVGKGDVYMALIIGVALAIGLILGVTLFIAFADSAR